MGSIVMGGPPKLKTVVLPRQKYPEVCVWQPTSNLLVLFKFFVGYSFLVTFDTFQSLSGWLKEALENLWNNHKNVDDDLITWGVGGRGKKWWAWKRDTTDGDWAQAKEYTKGCLVMLCRFSKLLTHKMEEYMMRGNLTRFPPRSDRPRARRSSPSA